MCRTYRTHNDRGSHLFSTSSSGTISHIGGSAALNFASHPHTQAYAQTNQMVAVVVVVVVVFGKFVLCGKSASRRVASQHHRNQLKA